MTCTFFESFVYDIVHPEMVLSFTPSSKKDEYYCQQLFMHKQSLIKCGIICFHVTHQKGREQEFRTAHIDSLLYFYFQEYWTIFAATKCCHAMPCIGIGSLAIWSHDRMSPCGVHPRIRFHVHNVFHRSGFTYTMHFTDQVSHTQCIAQVRFHIHNIFHRSGFTHTMYFTDQVSCKQCISQIRFHRPLPGTFVCVR